MFTRICFITIWNWNTNLFNVNVFTLSCIFIYILFIQLYMLNAVVNVWQQFVRDPTPSFAYWHWLMHSIYYETATLKVLKVMFADWCFALVKSCFWNLSTHVTYFFSLYYGKQKQCHNQRKRKSARYQSRWLEERDSAPRMWHRGSAKQLKKLQVGGLQNTKQWFQRPLKL